MPNQSAANHRAIDDFAGTMSIIGIHAATATLFRKVKSDLRRQGRLIGDFDLLIAATALVHDLTLVTNNTDHFGRIDGLRLESWVRSAV